MSSTINQQPLQRIVGRRQPRDGQQMTSADRAAMAGNACYRTHAPKGVFRYDSPEEMDADRLRWTVDLMAERNRSR